jgi:hypothetical protein
VADIYTRLSPSETPRARYRARRYLPRCQPEKPSFKRRSRLDKGAVEEEIGIFLRDASYDGFVGIVQASGPNPYSP